ncbi:MAG: hypothetical protein JNM25_08695 [Planctomycetes bacterium]|nr:hypothetical protein [Planctomycetota bacterium]
MKKKASLSLGGLLLAVLAAIFCPQLLHQDGARPPVDAPTTTTAPAPAAAASTVGFTSRASWQAHFDKHGAEFGRITADEYLALAQQLRDAPPSADVLENVRASDGVITRFDRKGGGFVAFHADKSIRTFFRPDDGEAYFRRQAER